jgi:hypothetical protein
MLDYIEPPDLRSTPRFQLPTLHGANVFEGDFFTAGPWQTSFAQGFDWIVGNPPWVQLSSASGDEDAPARAWMRAHAKEHPVARRQVAEAFAWHALTFARPAAAIALLVPAMSLFCEQKEFRAAFFTQVDVRRVLNLANLRRVLFAGRAEAAAAALLYMPGPASQGSDDILVFAPLVANQEANRPPSSGTRRTIWTITLNRSEIRSMPRADVSDGDPRPWKTSMWGSPRDTRLLEVVERRHSSLGALEDAGRVWISEGPGLRRRDAHERVEPLPEVAGQPTLSTAALKETGRIHVFPDRALELVPRELANVRVRGGRLGVAVCRPPHVLVHGGRNYAVFSEQFLVVPPRQIGIAAAPADDGLLRALALLLSSDFATYHQFFDSPQEGIRNGRSTLASLRRMPTPFLEIGKKELSAWTGLHRRVVEQSNAAQRDLLEAPDRANAMRALERELNEMVSDALGLDERQRWLVEDLVRVRRLLSDGRIRSDAVRAPRPREVDGYAASLRAELDEFLDPTLERAHRVTAVLDGNLGMVEVRVVPKGEGGAGRAALDAETTRALSRVRLRLERAHPQWLYFDRNLFLYDSHSWFILKPMQRFWWTRSQALEDADQLIAETLAAAGAS